MSKLIYLTLSHFNQDTRKFLLNRSGYTEQLDYELLSHNPLYELYWNNSSGLFEREPSAVTEVSGNDYFCVSVPLSNLRESVKDYLYERFLRSKYLNFDHYFLTNHRSLDSVFVYVPLKSRLCDKDNFETFKVSPKKECVKHTDKSLDGYFFYLNDETNNSYVLYSNKKETRTSWNLFDDYTCYYNKKFGGFLVSLKHYERLLSLGAQYKPKEEYTTKNISTLKNQVKTTKELDGYVFTLNDETNNSYVLYSTNKKETRTSWNLFDDYTCYYNKKYFGFIVSLRHHDRLVSMGAIELI
jgi:hypothetical protein